MLGPVNLIVGLIVLQHLVQLCVQKLVLTNVLHVLTLVVLIVEHVHQNVVLHVELYVI